MAKELACPVASAEHDSESVYVSAFVSPSRLLKMALMIGIRCLSPLFVDRVAPDEDQVSLIGCS